MGKPPIRAGRLQNVADGLGESIEDLVPRVMKEEGSILRTATRLGVAPNTIRYWLKKLGYMPKAQASVVWEREPEPVL